MHIKTKFHPVLVLNGFLTPKLLNSPFASWFLINLDFLLPHIVHFDNIIVLPLLVFEIIGIMFIYLFYTLNISSYTYYFKLLLIISLCLIIS